MLLPEEGRPRQQEDALALVLRLPVILDSEGMHEREDVCEFRTVANSDLAAAEDCVAHMRPVFFRLCTVEPERIPPLRQ